MKRTKNLMNKASVVALTALAAVAPVRAVAGEIASAVVNRDEVGEIASVTLDIRVGQGETAAIFRLSGATEGESGSTNGWEKVEWVCSCSASQRVTCDVPEGWGETVKTMRFILSDSEVYGFCKSLKTPQTGTTPYVNTGVIPTDKTRIHIKFNAPADMCMFGLVGRFGFFTPFEDGAIFPVFQNFDGVSQSGRPSIINCDVELTFGSGAYDNGDGTTSVGDTVVRTGGTTDSRKLCEQSEVVVPDDPITTPLPLFRRLNYNTLTSSKIAMNSTLYYAQIFEDDEMIRDFVPICTPDGTAALFDRCSRDVYYSANDGAFLLGDSTGEFICDGPLHVVDGTRTYSAADVRGAIGSATVNRDANGKIVSVTLDIRVGAGKTAAIFRLSGATAGEAGSTNGWERVEGVASCATSQRVTCAVPDGWGETVKAMSFIVSDSPIYPICVSLSSTAGGGQYISTGILPTDKTRICVDYFAAEAGVCAFGITEMFYCFNNSGTTAYLAFHNLNNGGGSTELALSRKRTKVSFGSGAYDNGDGTASPGVTVEYDSSPASAFKLGEQGQVVAMDNTAPLTLFCRMTRNGTAPTKLGACTIYSAQIYEDNELVRDFAPVKVGGVAAMYERCSRQFYYSATGGNFVPGGETDEFICDGQLRVIDRTITYSADEEPVGTGVIRSAKANRGADGSVMSVTLSLAVPANQTNVLYCACGARAGADGSTNGWESVTQVGLFTADTMLRCPVPQGWGGAAKAMRFFLSDAAGGKWLPVYTSLASTANGGEYISTGVIPTDRTRICIDYYTASLDVCAFGLTDRFYYFEIGTGLAYLGFQNLSDGGYNHDLNQHRLNITFGSGAFQNADGTTSPGVTTVDEKGRRKSVKLGEQSDVVDQRDVTSSIALFGRMTRDSTVLTKAGASAIYWAQLFENDLMVRDFVPVLDGDEGAMLDRCSGRLYYNAGGGALVLNTPTGEFQPTAIHVISASRTIRVDPDGFMILLK